MLYFDAAFIAKFYLQEPESEAVRALTEDSAGVVSLLIGRLETELVFSRKLREGALLAAGADPKHRDALGRNARNLAEKGKHADVAALLPREP
jgi:hypothetical protein